MPRLPIDRIDVLILDQIGKDISGTGMDPNVIGRAKAGPADAGPRIGRIIVRGLTPASEGNATGWLRGRGPAAGGGRAGRAGTYLNSVTAKALEGAKLPLTVDSDRDALAIALASSVQVAPGEARIVRARSTKDLALLLVSEPALDDVLAGGM